MASAGALARVNAMPAAITHRDTYVRYPIHGDSSRELIEQMDRLGPYNESAKRRFQGYTEWVVRWQFDTRQQGAGCSVENVRIDLDVQITLPDWSGSPSANPNLRHGWPDYLAALTEHELGHRENGVQAALAVRDALRKVDDMGDCTLATNAANAAARLAYGGFAEADGAYDSATDHGALAGVRLP